MEPLKEAPSKPQLMQFLSHKHSAETRIQGLGFKEPGLRAFAFRGLGFKGLGFRAFATEIKKDIRNSRNIIELCQES